MGTEVLHPPDVLSERLRIPHASFQRRKNLSGNLNINRRPPPNSNSSNRKTSPRPEKKKRKNFAVSAEESGGANRGSQVRKDDGTASGPVILLRRGESLDSLTAKIEKFKVEISKQKPKLVDDSIILNRKPSKVEPLNQKAIDDSIISGKKRSEQKPIYSQMINSYAGSAFSLSPPPHLLPFPSFCNKKEQNDSESVDDSATRDLRRFLRLD